MLQSRVKGLLPIVGVQQPQSQFTGAQLGGSKASTGTERMATGEAKPFIVLNNGKFDVTAEAEAVLAPITTPVVVVCVAGPYRTGKSFLLNQLLGSAVEKENSGGFAVGNTINACTRGIWLWGSPIERDGTTYLFLDTEGLGSLDQTQTFDTQIFSLSVLLSSLFVLNTQGTINESALQQLELVVECTKSIRSSASDDGDRLSTLAHHFPSFLWVLRDFALDLADEDGNDLSSHEYLEHALAPVRGRGGVVSAKMEEKNRIRSTISSVFHDRDCVTLVRPVSNEKDLKRLSTMSPSKLRYAEMFNSRSSSQQQPQQQHTIPPRPQSLKLAYQSLRPEFRQQMALLRDRVFSAPAKRVAGSSVNGRALLGLAKSYVACMNGGAVPTILSAWNSVVKIESQNALRVAIERVRNNIAAVQDSDAVHDSDALDALLKQAADDAAQEMRRLLVGDQSVRDAAEVDLQKQIAALCAQAHEINALRSNKRCMEIGAKLWEKLHMNDALALCRSADEVDALQSKFDEAFNAEAKGPWSEKCLRKTHDKMQSVVCTRLFAAVSESSERVKELQEKYDEANSALLQLRAEATANSTSLKEAKQALEDLQARWDSSVTDAAALQAQLMMTEKDLKEARKSVVSLEKQMKKSEKDVGKKDMQLQKLEAKLASTEADLKSTRLELEESHERDGEQSRLATVEREELKKEIRRLELDLGSMVCERDELTTEVEKLQKETAKFEQEQNALQRQLDEMESAPPPAPEVVVVESSSPTETPEALEAVNELHQSNITKLKSWLTSMDVDLPMKSHPRQFYVDLIYQHDPRLRGLSAPSVAAPPKKTKAKGRSRKR